VPWRGCSNPWNSGKCRSEYDLADEERECFNKYGAGAQTCKIIPHFLQVLSKSIGSKSHTN